MGEGLTEEKRKVRKFSRKQSKKRRPLQGVQIEIIRAPKRGRGEKEESHH